MTYLLGMFAVAGPDADLSIFNGLDLHVVPANSTLTFEHTYTWWGECYERVWLEHWYRTWGECHERLPAHGGVSVTQRSVCIFTSVALDSP